MIIKHVSEIFKIIMYDAALKTRLGKSLFCLVWMLVTVKKTAYCSWKKGNVIVVLVCKWILFGVCQPPFKLNKIVNNY